MCLRTIIMCLVAALSACSKQPAAAPAPNDISVLDEAIEELEAEVTDEPTGPSRADVEQMIEDGRAEVDARVRDIQRQREYDHMMQQQRVDELERQLQAAELERFRRDAFE